MKKFKIMLSVIMVVILIFVSVVPVFAVIAPEDSASSVVQGVNKIDVLLAEKMANLPDNELIPVWVWMTDIDMEKLENDIETKTGLSQQKLTTARNEISYDSLATSLNNVSLTATDGDIQSAIEENATPYLEATKVQRQEIAEDTEIYLSTKKTLARQQYISANSTKLRRLGISNDKIDFKSELTPTFIAFLTKAEIIEIAQSSDVVEIGYFTEYDEVYDLEFDEEPQQELTSELNLEPSEESTIDVSSLHTDIKQAIEYDEALNKYGVMGSGIKILHIDSDYVRSDKDNSHLIPNSNNIYDLINEETYSITDLENIPLLHLPDQNGNNGSHTNFCVSYLQSFAENVIIYSVPNLGQYYKLEEYNINPLEDIEYAITSLDVNLINSSSNEGNKIYESSFSAKWYDAIVSMYNIPIIASAGNGKEINGFEYPIAPASGYNSIAVGIYDSGNNMMKDNYTYNPIDSSVRVAHKPDLVIAMNPGGGTSAGAPVVSAIVAMMMELDPSLIGQPEAVKAILMASCHEKAQRSNLDATEGTAQETMEEGLTLKQGAGKVNVLRALNIVAYGTYGYEVFISGRNYSNAAKIHLNSQVNTSETSNYPLNASIAWLRHNVQTSSNPDDNEITLGDLYEFDLKVYYAGQIEEDKKESNINNSGKQLVFIPQPETDEEYTIRVYRDNENSVGTGDIMYGYAYSVGNFEKVLEKVEINGYTAVGKTLTANAYTADGLSANSSALTYRWYSSTDGTSWQSISGATSATYTLTDSDLGKYFKCYVEQDYLEWFEIAAKTKTKVVRFGDVDNDGDVRVIDANLIQQYVLGTITLTEEQLISADVTGEGRISSIDATLVQQYVAGIINVFPVEE